MSNEQTKPKRLTLAELGKIMLEKFGAKCCERAYGVSDAVNNPTEVGRQAINWQDINRDGTLN